MNKLFAVIDNSKTQYVLFTPSESKAYKCCVKDPKRYIMEFEVNVEPVEYRLYLDAEEFKEKYL